MIKIGKNFSSTLCLIYLYAFVVFLDIVNRSMFNVSTLTDALRTMTVFLIFTISVLFNNHTKYEFIWLVIGITLAFASFLQSKDKDFLLMILLMFSLSNVPLKKTFKEISITIFISLFLIWLFSYLGYIPNLPFERLGEVRWALGMQSPIIFSAYIFSGLVALNYIGHDKHPYLIDVLDISVVILLDRITNSRNDEICILILLLINIILKKSNKIYRFLINIAIFIFPFVTLISIFITNILKYPSKLYYVVNQLLSGRLGIQDELIKSYPIKLFGQNIPQTGLGGKGTYQIINYFYIDNSYARFLYMDGLLVFVFLIITIVVTLYKLNNAGHSKLALFLLLVCINGILVDTFAALSTSVFIPFYLFNVNEIKHNSC